MYNASQDFHAAVRSDSPVIRALLKFGDTLITTEDIQMRGGIEVSEWINPDKELTIGACPASTLAATVNNFHGLLSDFEFGECTASLGALTLKHAYPENGANVTAILRFGGTSPVRFDGYTDAPYLRVNGSAPTAQPPFAVYAIWIEGNTIVCIAQDGRAWVAAWIDGRIWGELTGLSWDTLAMSQWDAVQGYLIPAVESDRWRDVATLTWGEASAYRWADFVRLPEYNAFMYNKFRGWAERRRGMSMNGNMLYEFYADGRVEQFEFVKLGIYQVNTPKIRRQAFISISAQDRMTRFDVDAAPYLHGIMYPATLGSIYYGLCAFVGVPSATVSFVNSGRVFGAPPVLTEGVTAREALAWIAEAACSCARMTRDGEMELAWYGEREIAVTMDIWTRADIAEYLVSKIDKLQVRGSQTDIGVIVGDGTNAYKITDNPFLYGATDKEIRALCVPIYNRLAAVPVFSPISVTALCDWAVQAGDVIAFEFKGQTYRMPIYSQTITWRGNIRATYKSTGEERRPELGLTNRRLFSSNRAMHEFVVDVNGLKSRVSDTETGVAELRLTAQGLTVRVSNTEGNLTSLAQQTAEGFAQTVNKNGVISAINQSAEQISIRANRISLEGLTTINGSFKIHTDGSFEAAGGTIAGFRIQGDGLASSALSFDNGNGRINFGSYGYVEAGSAGFHFGSANRQFDFMGALRAETLIASNIVAPDGAPITITGSSYFGGAMSFGVAALASLKAALGL